MPIDKRMITWVILGAGLGAVVRSAIVPVWTGTLGLVVVGLVTVFGGLLAGVALGVRQGRASALLMGVAAGIASTGIYAVWGVTAALGTGVAFLVAVPLLTAVALTLGVSLVGIARHRHRTEAAS